MNTDKQSPTFKTTEQDTTRHISTERDGARHGVGRDHSILSESKPVETRTTEHQPQQRSNQDNSQPTTPTNDSSRHDTLQHVSARQDASMHDEARRDTTERDASRHDVASSKDEDRLSENWVDIQQAEILLRNQGVSRTTRTIQRFCQKGDLESRLVPTETGSRYIINERSIEALAKRLRETLPGNSFPTNETDSIENAAAGQAPGSDQITQSVGTDDTHMRQVVGLKDQHITMLQTQLAIANNQIAVKDEQFAAMIERDHETNILIQNLQRMVGLPEAKPRTDERHNSIDRDQRRNDNFSQSG